MKIASALLKALIFLIYSHIAAYRQESPSNSRATHLGIHDASLGLLKKFWVQLTPEVQFLGLHRDPERQSMP